MSDVSIRVKDLARPCTKCGLRPRSNTSWCLECHREYARTHPKKPKSAEFSAQLRLRTYGITQEQYDELLEKQNGVCAICQQPETRRDSRTPAGVSNLAIDHDHQCCPSNRTPSRPACGKCVRALLCARCNMLVGRLEADPEFYKALTAYMDSISA